MKKPPALDEQGVWYLNQELDLQIKVYLNSQFLGY